MHIYMCVYILYVYIYVCMYVGMCVCMYVCMHACMYVCTPGSGVASREASSLFPGGGGTPGRCICHGPSHVHASAA